MYVHSVSEFKIKNEKSGSLVGLYGEKRNNVVVNLATNVMRK